MRTITGRELEEFLEAQGVFALEKFIADSVYVLPGERFLRQRFAVSLQAFFKAMEQLKWEAEQSDCDDFERGAAYWASRLHKRSAKANGAEGTAVAFGEFWYQDDAGFKHAINCAIVSDEGEPMRLIFFEPQNVLRGADPIVPLSEKEKALCSGYRF